MPWMPPVDKEMSPANWRTAFPDSRRHSGYKSQLVPEHILLAQTVAPVSSNGDDRVAAETVIGPNQKTHLVPDYQCGDDKDQRNSKLENNQYSPQDPYPVAF